MIKEGRLDGKSWEPVFMPSAIAERNAVKGIQKHSEYLERCLSADSRKQQGWNDFYAHLASETYASASELESYFLKSFDSYRDEVNQSLEYLNYITDKGETDIEALISLCSLILNFSEAYAELMPDEMKNESQAYVDQMREFLVSINAFENHPESIRGVDTPTFMYNRL